jgi:hypothetical protein
LAILQFQQEPSSTEIPNEEDVLDTFLMAEMTGDSQQSKDDLVF